MVLGGSTLTGGSHLEIARAGTNNYFVLEDVELKSRAMWHSLISVLLDAFSLEVLPELGFYSPLRPR